MSWYSLLSQALKSKHRDKRRQTPISLLGGKASGAGSKQLSLGINWDLWWVGAAAGCSAFRYLAAQLASPASRMLCRTGSDGEQWEAWKDQQHLRTNNTTGKHGRAAEHSRGRRGVLLSFFPFPFPGLTSLLLSFLFPFKRTRASTVTSSSCKKTHPHSFPLIFCPSLHLPFLLCLCLSDHIN